MYRGVFEEDDKVDGAGDRAGPKAVPGRMRAELLHLEDKISEPARDGDD